MQGHPTGDGTTGATITQAERAQNARVAQAEHSRMVETLMAMVDMFEYAQQNGSRINFANVRTGTVRHFRAVGNPSRHRHRLARGG